MGVLSQTLGVVSACCLLMGTLVHGKCQTVTNYEIERFSFGIGSDQQLTIQLMDTLVIEQFDVTLTLVPTGTVATTTTTNPSNNRNQDQEKGAEPEPAITTAPPQLNNEFTCNQTGSVDKTIICHHSEPFNGFETEMTGELHIKYKKNTTCYVGEHNFYIVKDLTVYRQKTDKPEFYSLLQWYKNESIPLFGNVKCANGPDNFSKDDTAICVNSVENELDSKCIQYRHDDHGRHSETPFVPQCATPAGDAQACTIKNTTMNYNDNTINFELDDAAKYGESMLLEESIVDCKDFFKCEFKQTVAESRDLLFVSTWNAKEGGEDPDGRSVCFAPISFQDFQVKPFVIFDDTVEVEWKTVEDFSPGDSGNVNRFKAKIENQIKENPLERTPPFTEARVACTVPHACYIYFIDVEKVTYDIYVQPYMDSTYTQLNDNNIIQVAIPVEGPPTDGSTTERLNITSVRPVLRGGAPALSVCFRLGDPPKYDLDHFKVVLISPSGVWTSQVGGFRASEVEEEVEEEGTLVKERTSQKGSDGATTSVYCSPDVLLEEAWSGLEESVRVLVLGKDEEGNRIAGSSDVAIPRDLPKEIRVTRITRTSIPSKGGEGTNTPAYLKFAFEGYSLRDGEQLHLTYFSLSGDKVTQYPASVVGNQEVVFQIDNPEVIAVGAEPVLIFTARKTETDEPVAAGRVTYAPQDLTTDLKSLKNDDGNKIIVRAVNDHLESYFIDLGKHKHPCKKGSACYHVVEEEEEEGGEHTVCVNATDTSTTTNRDFELCTDMNQIESPPGEEFPDLVTTLTRPQGEQSPSMSLTSEKLGDESWDIDLLPYTDDETKYVDDVQCQTTKAPFDCTRTLSKDPQLPFHVLIFDKSSSNWRDADFSDYKVEAQQLMEDMVEVRWWPLADNADFLIHRSGEEEFYNEITTMCGNDNSKTCKGYFIGLKHAHYTIDVREIALPTNVVETEIEVTNANPPKEITVTRITKTSSPSKGEEDTNTPAYLKFAFKEYDLKEGEQLYLTYFNQSEKPVTQYPASFVGNQEVIFQIDNPEVIAVGAKPVLIFTARKTDTDEPVVAGHVTYDPQDFSSEPLNFIEGEEVTAIRVQPSEADHIDFSDESCKDSVCYFLGATNDDIVTICKKLTDVEYCEETSASDTSSLEESPTMVLTRESASDEVTLTLPDLVDDPDRSIDMVAWVTDKENTTIYSPPGYLCKGKKTNCTQVLQASPDGGSFKVIVTNVTNDAIKSIVKTFLDFNISATQFSNNTLEASWEAQTNANDGNANFVITLSQPKMLEEHLSVPCGEAGHDTRCKAYFVQKEAGEYVVRISLKEDQKNQVAYRMKMDTLEGECETGVGVGEGVGVTQVNNEAGSPLKLTVFFNNAPANDYHIVVVDTNGKWVSAEGTRSADDDTTEVRSQLEQHGDLELDSNFDIHSDVWVAVRTSEGKSGQAHVHLLLLTSLQQVGEDAIEVQWNDLGDSYAIEMQWNDLGDSYAIDKTHNVECEKSSSPCHFVLHQPYDSEDASVEVIAQGAVMQKATRVTSLQKLEGMELSTPTLRFDHKVQVCFKDEGTSDSYLLVLEDGDTLLLRENVSDIEIEGDRKCLISPSKFEVGALVSSWVLVTKFEGENVVRTGQTDWISLILSANRYVRAAFNKQKELHVSWHLLEDFTEESVQYRLTVRKPGGVEFEDNFQKDQAAHTLTVENEGSYTACVKAMVKDFVSEEVCSSIVVLDMNVEAPEIEKPEAFSSGGTAAMISWDSVEDATGYLVQWQNHSAGERQWNNGIVPPMVKGHARPQPLTSGEPNFVMVPPGVLTLEVDVSTVGDWDMCVAAVRDDMFGEEKCNKVSLGTGSDDKPDPPKNLQYSNNHISWEATEGPNIKYFVKWYLTDHPDSIAKSATTSKTSMDFDPEEPGKWSISVFALNQKVASDASIPIEIPIQGITMNVDQVDARSLKVTWWETNPDAKKDNYEYTLTLKNPDGKEVFNETKECSSTSEDSPCDLFAMGIDQDLDKVDVTVERTGVSKTKTITFLEFEEVKVRYQLRSSHNSTIIWSSVKGADMYNVSIFTDTKAPKLVFNQFRTIPTSCQFVTDLSVKGTYSTVQPCKDEHHCGARTSASPDESDDSTSDTAVFGSILAVLCVSLVLLIALVTFRLHKKKAANSSSSSEVELRPRDIPSFGTEPRLQRLQGRAAKGLPGFTEWQ